jgi:hypothetical protein
MQRRQCQHDWEGLILGRTEELTPVDLPRFVEFYRLDYSQGAAGQTRRFSSPVGRRSVPSTVVGGLA